MSAVPKKKLCWHCDGNIAKDVDNCPYCGVYLHAREPEEDNLWNPSYTSNLKNIEDILSPLYQSKSEGEHVKTQIQQENDEDQDSSSSTDDEFEPFAWNPFFTQLKQDVFPILFLMMGSVFFLFGVVLLLFSQNGTFTLQWQEKNGFYFLISAFPIIGLGWLFLQKLGSNE